MITDLVVVEYPNHDVLFAYCPEVAGVDEDGVAHLTGRGGWVKVRRLHHGDDEAQAIIADAAPAATET